MSPASTRLAQEAADRACAAGSVLPLASTSVTTGFGIHTTPRHCPKELQSACPDSRMMGDALTTV